MLITMDTNTHNARTHRIVRCNECKKPVRWDQRYGHWKTCKDIANKQKLKKIAIERDGLLLHAIACSRYHGQLRNGSEDWRLEIHYVHAEDINHARAQFCHAHPNRQTTQIMAVGLCIGWLANEKEKIIIH